MPMLLLLACMTPMRSADPAPDSGGQDSGAQDTETVDSGSADSADPCDWSNPVDVDLANWDTVGASGSSAAHFFDFALGPDVATMLWDDGVSSTVMLGATPEHVWEALYGPDGTCRISLYVTGTYSLATDDGRLVAALPFQWEVEVATWADQDIGGVVIRGGLDPSMVAVPALGTDSGFGLDIALQTNGARLAAVKEAWALDEHITRTCVRASIGDTPGLCYDEDDRYTGE